MFSRLVGSRILPAEKAYFTNLGVGVPSQTVTAIPPNTQRLRFMNLIRRIKFRKNFVVQVLSSGLLACTSDILCQKYVEKRRTWDPIRSARFAAIVTCCMAPMSYKWFQIIERLVPSGRASALKTGIKRMALDQILAAPVFTSVFLFNLNVLESRNFTNSLTKTATIFVPVITTNYKIWPLIQLINMSLIPLQYRVILVNFCGLFWNMYISYTQHNLEDQDLAEGKIDV
uniref:Mitochondrial inner membrane protein Mpv17 n=1 Tax=Panagrellus redivivus TaxID=6233 RepID=A0A7E4V166_PANRE